LVSKHIVRVVLDNHVISIDVVFDRQAWLYSFIRAFARSCSLIVCSVEVSFKRSFSFSSLFEGFLVQVNQVLGYIALLCNMISTTTTVALKGFFPFLKLWSLDLFFLCLFLLPFLALPTFLDDLFPSTLSLCFEL
jgi:hypothetical protein